MCVPPAHATREAVEREPCRDARVTVLCRGAVSGPLQISPAAALDRISHPVLAALDFPRSGVTVVPWLWLPCSTGCRWCQAVHSSRVCVVLGSPTSAALPVARTVTLFWPPPVCWDRPVTWTPLGLTASRATQVSHRAVWLRPAAWGVQSLGKGPIPLGPCLGALGLICSPPVHGKWWKEGPDPAPHGRDLGCVWSRCPVKVWPHPHGRLCPVSWTPHHPVSGAALPTARSLDAAASLAPWRAFAGWLPCTPRHWEPVARSAPCSRPLVRDIAQQRAQSRGWAGAMALPHF